MQPPLTTNTSIDEIIENFSFLDEWDDRYGYLIELGKSLTPLTDEQMVDLNKVQGCVSQVWLIHENNQGILTFNGMSDAHIVRGLVAIALSIFSGKSAEDILQTDEQDIFNSVGLQEHLTPQRANGLRSMVQRIKAIAQASLTT
jgi:cysteine desulfuration protein SufE